MPEIVIAGLRHTSNGPSEQQHKHLEELRQQHRIQLWSLSGTAQECEDSWLAFLLEGMPEGSEVLG